jgi:hypothetical protein
MAVEGGRGWITTADSGGNGFLCWRWEWWGIRKPGKSVTNPLPPESAVVFPGAPGRKRAAHPGPGVGDAGRRGAGVDHYSGLRDGRGCRGRAKTNLVNGNWCWPVPGTPATIAYFPVTCLRPLFSFPSFACCHPCGASAIINAIKQSACSSASQTHPTKRVACGRRAGVPGTGEGLSVRPNDGRPSPAPLWPRP